MFSPKSRVLVVDDMLTMRKLVVKALVDLGFKHFGEAADGGKAWEVLNNTRPPFDLIISDLNMPVTNGVELLKKVRADERFKKIPFILLTAESEVSVVASALMEGANGYLVKPFSLAALVAQLQKIATKSNIGKKKK